MEIQIATSDITLFYNGEYYCHQFSPDKIEEFKQYILNFLEN